MFDCCPITPPIFSSTFTSFGDYLLFGGNCSETRSLVFAITTILSHIITKCDVGRPFQGDTNVNVCMHHSFGDRSLTLQDHFLLPPEGKRSYRSPDDPFLWVSNNRDGRYLSSTHHHHHHRLLYTSSFAQRHPLTPPPQLRDNLLSRKSKQ